ncbi:hypothetical protein VHEMI05791 [[Torrubiella] hemipterigena]|nr:hypothetical protein VHEMI05791 [[Torrubiella] hemipterigena]
MLPIKKKMSPARRVCQTVPLNAFKDEIVICHLLEKFSIGLGPSMAGVTDAPTMASVLTSHNANSNAYISGLGLAEAFFGHVQKVDGMTEHASELYGQALRNLRDDLQLTDQKVARSRAYMNLWSCVFLGLYEIVAASGQSSWMQHSKGMGILTELLGPSNFQSPVANTILDMNRSFIATSYIVERKHCFLGRPEWQTVPWERWTRPRTIISRTTDILCDVPGLMEDADAIIQAEEQGLNTEADKLLLQDNLLQRIQRLADLVWQWDLSNPLACWEAPIDSSTSFSLDESGQPLFDTVYHFDDVERAIDVLNLNVVRLLLYGACDKAGLLDSYVSTIVGSQYDGPHANPLLLPGQGDRISHSLEICLCVDFLLSNPRQSRGALVLLFPLRVAWTYLGPLPAVSRWVGKVLMQLSTSQGLRIGEHVLDIDSR